jgi:site-specific DNA-methyltransferase (adenine-specific)
MNRYKTDLLDLRCMDCMGLLRDTPDNAFDLGIIDPQYGIGESGGTNHSRSKLATAKNYKPFAGEDKEPPTPEYFKELCRVTKNQIIWGANHFADRLVNPASPSWIVWDKENGDSDFADCELAYTSFKGAVRKFTFRWAGMLQGNMKNKEVRIHGTQKPVALYKWLLHNYAKPGDKILDTHLGSCSIAIACHYAGYHLTGCELDEDYFKAGVERVKRETAQRDMFTEGLI